MVQALWLLILWSLQAYMIVNFRIREINQVARKLIRIFILINNNNNNNF
jgi:hypothetical protein